MKLNLSYKQKLRILPAVVSVAIILVYIIAISRTIQLNRYCKKTAIQNLSSEELKMELETLSSRMLLMEGISGRNGTLNGTDPLLNFISIKLKQSGELVEYLPLHECRIQNHIVSTRIAVIESDYRNHLIFLNDLEKNYMDGKVVSVRFESDINMKSGKKRLLMTIYIQSIRDDKSN